MKQIHPIEQEEQLLRKLKDDNRRAFDSLYNHYSPRIYGRLLRLTGSEDLSIELLQETFIILWDNRHRINPDQCFRGWIYKVAENCVYQYYRKLARTAKLQQHIAQIFEEGYLHTEENMILKESLALLKEAVALLPEKRRKVFELCRIKGLRYEEAAKMLEISSSTVSNHLVKATAFVKEYVSKSQGRTLVKLIALLMLD
ncbi:RNA polymerase sigma factor [Sphingobacterium bambusae]|uniref:RNA polymerase sigma factor n=1 Tax=Sphingobacterium bambusae TaxID=662858 RepID=A0ABW6BKS7_9SPHI|nr:sigma-70 family RNA polymerase sigma factor [Sphingobacterium bambusae]WPL50909.1 sigma-70 family RNA polymerase sigma factor [Sphingobacterium bambusae]